MGQRLIISEEERSRINKMYGLVNEQQKDHGLKHGQIKSYPTTMDSNVVNYMTYIFPDLSDYGLRYNEKEEDRYLTVTYTDGPEQLVFKIKKPEKDKAKFFSIKKTKLGGVHRVEFSVDKDTKVYIGASGDRLPSLMSKYKGKEYPIKELDKIFVDIKNLLKK